ncbi:MAG: sialate O-acetylesterase, partial [Terrimicrobiaceae bacterium]
MPAIFSDNMVLQRDMPVPVWGEAPSGENIVVKFNGQEKSVTTDAEGRWKAYLDPLPVSTEPSTLSVVAASGQKEFKNVLVGEVWLCSGQSNMQATAKSLEIPEEIQDA